jgi:uncharacterized protein (DUF4415 family)
MSAKSKNIKSNLKKMNKHRIKKNEYEDLPELTDEMMNRAVYKVAGVEKPSPKYRGKQKKPTKIPVYIRLPPEVVDYFKAEGLGWQSRIGEILKKWIKSHPHLNR